MSRKFSPSIVFEAMEHRVLFDASALTETIVGDTLPTSISDHITAQGKISVSVANNSGVEQKGPFFIDAVATTSSFLDLQSEGTFVLAGKRFEGPLQNGESKTIVIPVTVRKAKYQDTTYNIYGIAADRFEQTSQSAADVSFTVHPPLITLSETESFVRLPSTELFAGGKFNVTDKVSITNSGTDPSTDKLTVDVFATSDGNIADGELIKSFTPRPGIRPGKTSTVSFQLSKLPELANGVYDLITQVTLASGVSTTTDPAAAPTITVGPTQIL